MELFLRYVAHSEIGLVRKNNQDSGYASPHLLVVADGMGGAAAGDLASAAAIQLIRRADRAARGEDGVGGEAMLELLAGALNQANDKIADLVADDHSLDGMGTTVTGAMFDGEQLGLVHIGDSRAYLFHDGELRRLTHDHSWVQSLVDEGKITEAEAAYHPHRSLLLKVLNGQPAVEPDTDLVEVSQGDRLLLCSDGLCGLVDDEELSRVLGEREDLDSALQDLIDAAHREGGIDNITIIVAELVPDAEQGTTGAKILGAATEREVPAVSARPVELGDTAPARRTDADGNTIPDSPAPRASAAAADEETSRYAPREAPRRGRWRLLLAGLLALILIAGGLTAGWAWSRTQYFVGPSDGRVAINRGLAQPILGVSLAEVYRVEDTQLTDLPPFYRERVEQTITSASLSDAEATVLELRAVAKDCVAQRERRLAPPIEPTPSPSALPGNPPGNPPGPEPTLPTPEPTPTPAPTTTAPAPAGGEC